jgi:hypothetical protein
MMAGGIVSRTVSQEQSAHHLTKARDSRALVNGEELSSGVCRRSVDYSTVNECWSTSSQLGLRMRMDKNKRAGTSISQATASTAFGA